MTASQDEVSAAEAGVKDLVGSSPYFHFVVSEAWATAASGAVYCFSRLVAWLVQFVDQLLPLNDPAPLVFMERIMSWGGSFVTAAVFLLTTGYQLIVLLKRLYRGIKDEQ
jgi:hypothetical protein